MTERTNYNSGIFLNIMMALICTMVVFFAARMPAEAAINFTVSTAYPNSDTQVTLNWHSVQNAVYYHIYRDDILIKTININTDVNYTSYLDTGLAPETQYTYKLVALSSDMTEIDNAVGTVTTTKMLRPNVTSVVFDINTREITITWSNHSLATTRNIVKKYNGSQIAELPNNDSSLTFFDAGLTNNPTQYTITSLDDNGHSSQESLPFQVVPVDAPVIAARMQNGTATISWTSNWYSSIYYSLERSRYNGSAWSEWAEVNSQVYSSSGSITDTPDVAGTYRYRLSAKGNYKGFSNISEPVSKPAAPKDLTCRITGSNRIELTWTNDPNNNCQLKVQKRTNWGNYITIATIDSSETSYSDITSITAGSTYYYKIAAYDSDNNQAFSNEASVSASAPGAPSSLTLTVLSASSIQLNWMDNSTNETTFFIERKTDQGDFEEIGSVSEDTTTYIDTDLDPSHVYVYRVRAYNHLGYSTYTNTVAASTNIITPTPDSLEVVPISPNRIDLSWTYPTSGSYNTLIERRKASEQTWTVVANVPQGIFNYSDNGLQEDTEYFYRICSVAGSNVYSARFPNDTGTGVYTLLNKPTNLSAYMSSSSYIVLSWTDNSNETNFVIERKSGNNNFVMVGSTAANITTWHDTNIEPNTQYTYRIIAKTLTNQSLYSDQVTITSIYLEAPSNLTVGVIGDSSVMLTWNDNSSAETGFEIWRKTGISGTWEKYALVGRNTRNYVDMDAALNEACFYKVRAYISHNSVFSAYSNEAGTSILALSPPTNLSYSIDSNSRVILSWTDNSSLEGGYKVERKTETESYWTEIASLPANSTTYMDSNVDPGKAYYYRIKVYSISPYQYYCSNELKVSFIKPQQPTNLILKLYDGNWIELNWKDNSTNETGFRIERKEPGKDYSVIAEVAANTTKYMDKNTRPGVIDYYRVIAFNPSSDSESSNVKYIRTMSDSTFKDVPETHWAKDAIGYLTEMDVLKGKSNDMFVPSANITRAEFVCLVIRAFGLDRTPVGYFTDVKPSDWFYKEIMTAKALGIITGDNNNRFYPLKNITREDMAVIIAKALRVIEKPLPSYDISILEKFKDYNDISGYALSSIACLNGEGIITGKGGNMIMPKAPATRAEAALIVYKVLLRIEE